MLTLEGTPQLRESATLKVDRLTFYETFGKNLKLGIHEDSQNHAKLAGISSSSQAIPNTRSVTTICFVLHCGDGLFVLLLLHISEFLV